MNCAIMPYRDTNVKLLMLDQKLPLRYGTKLEKSLSDLGKSLMQGILNYELKKRLNLPRIQAHEWLNIAAKEAPPAPPPIETQTKSLSEPNAKVAASPHAKAVMEEMKTQSSGKEKMVATKS